MNEYYYIARRKRRGAKNPHYIGDGIINATSVKEVRDIISYSKACPKKHIIVELRKKEVSRSPV